MWGAGALEGRVISESEHQKGKVIHLCKLFKGRVTLLFQIFLMRMDKLPKNTGIILQRRDWKSEYYRLLDLESTHQTSFQSQKKKSIDWYKKLFPQEAYFRELDFAVFCVKHVTLPFSNGF